MNSGLGHRAKVSSIILNDSWTLPTSNHVDIIDFWQSFNYFTSCNPGVQDSILWDSLNIREVKVASIWNSIRKRGSSIDWYKTEWHKNLPPRFSFLLWMSFHIGLRMKDRLINYGVVLDPSCLLCKVAPESFNHFFFLCPFLFQVLISVLHFCGWRGFSRS